MLPYILLGFLSYQPMTGYELKNLMDDSTQHFWHAHHSQIYTTLRRLEEKGWLVSVEPAEDDPLNRRAYSITESGRSALQSWLDKPLLEIESSKHALLVRVFFSGSREPSGILRELRFQRQLHQQQLEQYREQEPAAPGRPDLEQEVPFWRATLDFGRRYEAMVVDWLDDQIARVEAGRRPAMSFPDAFPNSSLEEYDA